MKQYPSHPRTVSAPRRTPCAATAAGLLAATLIAAGCAPGTPTLVEQIKQSAANHHVARGDEYVEKEKLEDALREFDLALKFNPKLATAHSRIGKVYRKMGQLVEAAREFAEAVRLDPMDFISSLSLGQVYQLLADKSPDRNENLKLAVRAYQHACELRNDDFESHLNLGVCLHQLGDFDQAIEQYKAALAIDPQNGVAIANLGAAYDSHGNYYDAIRMYKTALEVGANQPMVLVNLGTTYIKQNRLQAAMETLRAAVKQDPQLSVAYQWLGYCYHRSGRYDEALAAYGSALQYDPKNAEANAGRGIVYMTMYLRSRRQPQLRELALEHWHRSLELDSNQPRLRDLVAKYGNPNSNETQTATLSP